MPLLLFKLLAIAAILAMSLIAGMGPIRARIRENHHIAFPFGEAMASGIFLGAALFHMLPNAEIGFHNILGPEAYPYADLLCALGFILLLFMERVVLYIVNLRMTNTNLIPYILTIVLSVHAITEGTALGINTTLINTAIIFLAIMIHKGSESFALAINLSRSQLPVRRMLETFFLFALMTPIGIAIGAYLTVSIKSQWGGLLESGFNAFAAGSFLYIATLHQLGNICKHDSTNRLQEFIATLVGLSLMAVVAIWI